MWTPTLKGTVKLQTVPCETVQLQLLFSFCFHVAASLILCDVICVIIFTWAMVAVVAALKIMPHNLKPNGTKIMIITSFLDISDQTSKNQDCCQILDLLKLL